MPKFLLLTFAVLMTALFRPQAAQAQENKLVMAGVSGVLKTEPIQLDNRVEKLTAFLEKYDSLLTSYAPDFIEMADKYQIDWKLLPAITGVESTFGKQIPSGSYNAYGWNNGNYRFQSWEDSLEIVSKALREKYYNRGLDNPYKIGPVYAPPSSTWAGKVSRFMNEIEGYNNSKKIASLVLTI